MRLILHGAARTVTGSQHLLEINGQRLLLECGLFQGKRAEAAQRNCCFSFPPAEVDAVILSHAHIDHSGNLPNLVKQGFNAPIYTTRATADLADIMLRDSGHIQQEDAEYLNRKKRRHGEPLVEPLYTIEDAARVSRLFHTVGYDQPFEPVKGVSARLFDAGHILGSAAVKLDLEENGRKTSLWFSGDIGRFKLPLIPDPVLPFGADTVLMECTYGDRAHDDPEAAYQKFRAIVLRTIQRGGKVIIPAFAVGRTQELVFSLNRMRADGELPRGLPVFVDSPLAIEATGVFRRNPEFFDAETYQFIEQSNHPALDFPNLHLTRSAEESKTLNQMDEPMVIISASGMAETGRILHHLKNNIGDKRSTVCIVSWQAPNTLGRRLAERQPVVRIFGEEYQLKAEVAIVNGLSAHAGQNLLLRYAQTASQNGAKSFALVHGDEQPARVLMGLMNQAGMRTVSYPEPGTVITL